MRTWEQWVAWADRLPPGVHVVSFCLVSMVMLWRLDAMMKRGLEGTVLGTLVMPYCSGLGNLIFVYVVVRHGLPGSEVVTNCLVNNVTNMTLLIGLPALLWQSASPSTPAKRRRAGALEERQRLSRLAMLLTLVAVAFFTGVAWALGRDGRLSWSDGWVLAALFLFWQCVHVFDVLKDNVRQSRSFSPWLIVDGLILLAGSVVIYQNVQSLVHWVAQVPRTAHHLGWLSGWLMVLPNAVLALYYGWRRRLDIVYTSQVGDGHICIPLCLGLAALAHPIVMPRVFGLGVTVLLGAVGLHVVAIALLGRLPRVLGLVLVAAYGVFVYRGFPS